MAEGKTWTATFAAEPAASLYTLRLRHRDVKQKWRLRLNDHDLGSLPIDENQMTAFWEIPAGTLVPGPNRLSLAATGQTSDDSEVGDLRLIDRPRREALRAATVDVSVSDAESGQPLPSRVTVVDEHGSLMTVGAQSSKRLAVRPGVIYTADGRAEFGLPAGKYTVYTGRGFEYGIDAEKIEVAEGQQRAVRLTIRREMLRQGA